jgi:hypothetical protein
VAEEQEKVMGGFGEAFQNADMKDQLDYLKEFNPSFAKADPKTQSDYLNEIHYSGSRAPIVPSTEPGQETPGIFSGWNEGPTGAVAPGEGVGHAIGREAISAIPRAARSVATMPVGIAKAALAPPQNPEELGLSVIPGAAGDVAIAAKRMLYDPAVQEHEAAGRSFQNSLDPTRTMKNRAADLGAGLIHSIAQFTPIVGPWVGNKVSEAEQGHIGAGPEFGLEYGGFKAVPEIGGKAIEKFHDYRTNPATGIEKYKAAMDFPSGKGGQRATAGNADVDVTAKDLAEIQRQSPMKGKKAADIHQHAEAIDAHQQRIWDEAHKPQIQRWESDPIDHDYVGSEARKALPAEGSDASPEETTRAKKWIDEVAAKPRTLTEADDFQRRINDDIKGKPFGTYGRTEIMARQLAAKANRQAIDNVLISRGEPGVLEFNRRWGALDNLKERAQEQAVAQARAEAKEGDLPEWAKPYIFLHPGWGAAYGLTARIPKAFEFSPGRSLRSGLEQLARSPLEVPPNPPFRLVPPQGRVQPSEQLPMPTPPLRPLGPQTGGMGVGIPGSPAGTSVPITSGDFGGGRKPGPIITPPPADASFVRGVDPNSPQGRAMTLQPHAAPLVTPPPSDTSGSFGWGKNQPPREPFRPALPPAPIETGTSDVVPDPSQLPQGGIFWQRRPGVTPLGSSPLAPEQIPVGASPLGSRGMLGTGETWIPGAGPGPARPSGRVVSAEVINPTPSGPTSEPLRPPRLLEAAPSAPAEPSLAPPGEIAKTPVAAADRPPEPTPKPSEAPTPIAKVKLPEKPVATRAAAPAASLERVQTKEGLETAINELGAKGRQLREASTDQSLRGMRPADADWLSEEDTNKLDDLQSQWSRLTQEERSPAAAAARVAEKRAAAKQAVEPPLLTRAEARQRATEL